MEHEDEIVPKNTRVRMLFDDGKWYPGRVEFYNEISKQYRINFDDGDRIYVTLPDADVEILDPPPNRKTHGGERENARRTLTPVDQLKLSQAELEALAALPTVQTAEQWEDAGLDRVSVAALARAPASDLDIVLPQPLLLAISQDWLVTASQHRIYKLPQSPTVAAVLEEYGRWKKPGGKSRRDKESGEEASTGEHATAVTVQMRGRFAQEMLECFEKVVGTLLLYEGPEQEQFQAFESEAKYAEQYGLIYLTRLLLRLPECSLVLQGSPARKALAGMASDLALFLASHPALATASADPQDPA